MVEIESNKSIKGFKQEYVLTFGLLDLVVAGVAATCGITAYVTLTFLPDMMRGDICMIIVMAIMCLANFKINNMLLYKLAIKKIGNLMYFGKAILYKSGKERKKWQFNSFMTDKD